MAELHYPFALLVIDVQQGLFARPTHIYNEQAFLSNVLSLIACARQYGALVIFVQHCNDTILAKDTPAWQLHPSLQPRTGDLHINKRHGSAFEETELETELISHGIQKLVICGLVTHGCVKAGCLDALKLGYQTTLISDAHSSYSKDAAKLIKEWNNKLEQAGAVLLTTAQFIQREKVVQSALTT
jgi:nicotinamidase-related amidase